MIYAFSWWGAQTRRRMRWAIAIITLGVVLGSVTLALSPLSTPLVAVGGGVLGILWRVMYARLVKTRAFVIDLRQAVKLSPADMKLALSGIIVRDVQ